MQSIAETLLLAITDILAQDAGISAIANACVAGETPFITYDRMPVIEVVPVASDYTEIATSAVNRSYTVDVRITNFDAPFLAWHGDGSSDIVEPFVTGLRLTSLVERVLSNSQTLRSLSGATPVAWLTQRVIVNDTVYEGAVSEGEDSIVMFYQWVINLTIEIKANRES
jgi:hypothetical protein